MVDYSRIDPYSQKGLSIHYSLIQKRKFYIDLKKKFTFLTKVFMINFEASTAMWSKARGS